MEEVEFDIETLTLRGKRWRKKGKYPVIALHGWLDNCATFDLLAPQLTTLDIVALDLAGHGQSDHRGSLGAYNIWQDITEVLAVADQLGWETFGLLGHSRGAMISMLIAGTFPERVTHLALIESMFPHVMSDEEAPRQLAESIQNVLKLRHRKRNYYASFELAVSARADGFIPLPEKDAKVLAQRGVKHDGHGFYWANDPLLLAPSEVKFTEKQARAFADQIVMDIALILGKDGMLKNNDLLKNWLSTSADVNAVTLEGEHHLHMSQQWEEVSEFLMDYFKK